VFTGEPIAFEFAGSSWLLCALGDRAIRVELVNQEMSFASCGAVQNLSAALRSVQVSLGIQAQVPAYASLMLTLHRDAGLISLVSKLLEFFAAADSTQPAEENAASMIQLQLLPEPGLDAALLADTFGISIAQLRQQFCAASYQVAQIGFRAGFPYLIGLPPALSFARRASVRAQVPALSVAIGGYLSGCRAGRLARHRSNCAAAV
jgi:allophanate hydrolase subunit 1